MALKNWSATQDNLEILRKPETFLSSQRKVNQLVQKNMDHFFIPLPFFVLPFFVKNSWFDEQKDEQT